MKTLALCALLASAAAQDQKPTIPWRPLKLADALKLATERRVPVFIAMNMDNEMANDLLARETYRDPEVVAAASKAIALISSPVEHRIEGPCPRFAEQVTCADHRALEAEVREQIVKSEFVTVPQHILLRPDGTQIVRREYLLSKEDLLKLLRSALLEVNRDLVMGEARARHAAALAKLAAPGGGPWLETIKELSVSDDDLAMIALLDAGRALAEPERRAAVAREVGMLGNVRAWESLIEWLADPDARVRREAARSLAKVDREKAFEPLVDRLEEEPDPGAREALFKALGVGDAGGTRTIEQEKPERFEAVVVALGLSGDAAVLPHLIKLARSGDPAAARRAAEALGRCPSPASFEALVALLEDGRAPGMQAPRALAELGDPKAVAPLRRALGAAHPSVRRGACEALGRLKAADAAGDLRKRLEDEDAGVRVEAGRALFRLGDDSGVPVMIGVLEDRWECADARRALVEIAGTDQGDAAAWSAWWAAKRK